MDVDIEVDVEEDRVFIELTAEELDISSARAELSLCASALFMTEESLWISTSSIFTHRFLACAK